MKATLGALYLGAPTTVSAGGALKAEAASGATLALATDFSNVTFDIGGEGTIKLTGSLTDGTLVSSGAIRLNGNGSLRNVYVKAANGLMNSGTLTLVGCVLAGSSGDGLSNSGTATLVNCVVAANKGRGVYSSGTTYVYNSIVAGNFGGDVVNASRGKTLGENNLSVYSNWTEALYPETAQEITIADFFAVPPVFDEEGNLANADQLDLSPPLLSVATNVGDSARAAQYGLGESAFDIVGNARVYDGCVDVGAYEATGFGASQSGVFNGGVDFTWEQPLDEAVALRLTWISGAKSSVLGVFGASGEFAWDTTSFDDGAGRLIVEYLDENDAVLKSATIAATIINDENVVVKRGTIDENETWEADKVYLVVGRLDVASGATLTLG
ncbi:MAG: right-handed parallel beta-helix repeat-containing protein, partial [Thermoguttaceae bacterium]|nr:right-handed parallel beta-helix repeat-containing protein [Thermoguttaceae bacterium]